MLIRDIYQPGKVRQGANFPRLNAKNTNPETLYNLPPDVSKAISDLGVGIEIEVENSPGDIPLPRGWLSVNDPSLRNNGIEYITRYGVRVGETRELLNKLETCLKDVKLAVGEQFFDFNERTSVHIHLDARNLNTYQVTNFCVLYTLFEDSLFKYVAPDRINNIYCTPIRSWQHLPYIDSFEDTIASWEKYSALNLCTLKKYGTFEFRHMEGNLKPAYIHQWIVLLGLIYYAAMKMSPQDVQDFVSRIKYESHYQMAVERIFLGLSPMIAYDARDIDNAASDAKFFFSMGDK